MAMYEMTHQQREMIEEFFEEHPQVAIELAESFYDEDDAKHINKTIVPMNDFVHWVNIAMVDGITAFELGQKLGYLVNLDDEYVKFKEDMTPCLFIHSSNIKCSLTEEEYVEHCVEYIIQQHEDLSKSREQLNARVELILSYDDLVGESE